MSGKTIRTGRTSRRAFLKRATAAGAAAMTASSYSRILGANERISVGIIGCGNRGRNAHMAGLNKYAESQNMEITAVCDPWRQRREDAAEMAKEWYGRKARTFVSYRDVMALGDVDAVTIASCDHQHTTHLEAAARAKKDVYCEKPLGMDFKKLRKACDAVRESDVVFQAGTQLRSLPSMRGCRKLFKTGILGTVGRIEQHRNSAQPYWYRYVEKNVDKKDVDWKEFLMDLPMRPFDPVQFTGWYGYRDFSDGPVPGLGSHFIDLVHYITGAEFPESAVCLGGTYSWKDEHGFTCPDHVEALWTYPEGFMVTYSTNFGNSAGKSFKMYGDQGTLDLVNWTAPILTAEGGIRNKGVIRGSNPVEDVEGPDHYLNWLQCVRDRRTPHASIEAGYRHGVAVIMAMRAFDTGRRQVYDREKRKMGTG